jgi:hypothetical protein
VATSRQKESVRPTRANLEALIRTMHSGKIRQSSPQGFQGDELFDRTTTGDSTRMLDHVLIGAESARASLNHNSDRKNRSSSSNNNFDFIIVTTSSRFGLNIPRCHQNTRGAKSHNLNNGVCIQARMNSPSSASAFRHIRT